MLLRRMVKHVNDQNWLAIGIDFVIVVSGVFLGLQFSNWNEAQANKEGAQSALLRLQGEVELNMASAENRIDRLSEFEDVRDAGLTALSSCDASDEGMSALGAAVGQMTGDIIPSFVTNTTKEIARQYRYLDLYSEEFRSAVNLYDSATIDEIDQLKINFQLMWDQHIITHPFVGVTLGDNDVEQSLFTFNQPMEVLCGDGVFGRQLVMTEGWHQSTKLRLERYKVRSDEFLEVLDREIEAQK